MANTHSAEKRNRQAIKRNGRNNAVKTAVRGALKAARAAVASGDKALATAAVIKATSALDTAASKGVLHRKNASRHVARLQHLASKPVVKVAAK